MKSEVSHLYLAAQSFAGLLLGRSQQIDMEPLAVQRARQSRPSTRSENSHARLDPDGDRLPALAGPDPNPVSELVLVTGSRRKVALVERSKCLPQGDKELR